MKGKATIELFDKNGLLKKKVEKTNLITSAIDNIMNTPFPKYFGIYKTFLPFREYAPIYTDILGGIFLFNSTRTEDVNHVLPTSEDFNSYVGSAGGNYPNGQTTKVKGSLNLNESGFIQDEKGYNNGYKFVWDFNMAGAYNIASLSLTSRPAGNVGLDFDFNDSSAIGEVFGKYLVGLKAESKNTLSAGESSNYTNIPPTYIKNDGQLVYISEDYKTIVFCKYVNSSYNLTKYTFKDAIGLTDYFTSTSDNITDYPNWILDVTYNVAPTTAILRNKLEAIYCEGEYIYSVQPVVKSEGILTINFVKIDVNTMTIDDERVFDIETDCTDIKNYVICDNKLLIVDGTKDKLLTIDLDSNALINTFQFTARHSTYACYLVKFTNDLVGLYDSTNTDYMFLVDLNTYKYFTCKLSGTSGGSVNTNKFNSMKRIGQSPVFISKSIATDNDDINYVNVNIFEAYFASILNLDSVISKGETDTLKITYEVTN